MPDRIDRRSFLARGAATAAGVGMASAGGGLLSACGSGTGGGGGSLSSGPRMGIATGTPRKGGSLVFGVEAEEQGFDPATGRFDETGILYARTVFDPLTILADDGSVQPYLAQQVTPNGDYSVWTITPRPNVQFHDGTPCDAAAIAGSLEHFSSGLLGITVNPVLKSISTTGYGHSPTDTVIVTLKQPWVPFSAYLAGGIGGQVGYIIAPSMIAAGSNGTKQPVGTGPFKFREWTPNDHFTAVRNPNYWRSGYPYLDQITFKPITDPQQRANSLMAGTIDIMHTDLPESILQFRSDPSYNYVDDAHQTVGQPDMYFAQINTQAAPMNDLRVRQAMAMAVNQQQYSVVVDKGVNKPTNQPFVPGTPYYVSDAGYPAYNPSQARQLVDAVARDFGHPVSFTYATTTSPAALRAAQFLQNQWQAVGFHVGLNQVQQADLINLALNGGFQVVGWRQFAATDPDLNYLFWSPTEIFGTGPTALAPNFARNTDPEVELLLQEGRRVTDPNVRAQAYQGVAKRFNQDIPYIWETRTTWAVVSKGRVQNFNNPTTVSGSKAYGMLVGTVWNTQIWLSA